MPRPSQANSQRPKERDGVLSTLNVAIETLNLAKEICSITPAKAAFGSVSVLLIMIRESIVNAQDCVDLGLSCADVCKALDRGLKGKRLDDLSQSVLEAIQQFTTTVAEIERKIIKQAGRNAASRLVHAKSDKEKIAGWKLDLNRILNIFSIELAINTHTMVADIHRNVLISQGNNDSVQPSIDVGEAPPPAPRVCFGRDELVGRIIGLVENLTPIALIGAGGIGKTSIALTVLHHGRIKERFGDNRRFIRCDQFTASCPNLLRRLSKVIGAGVENPEDLAPLRPFLTSKEMLIILDNAESILDPQGANGQEISAIVEELSRFNNICLCITSRITTVPPDCETLKIPTLPMEAARNAFYRIYKRAGQSGSVNDILEQLDFHPLSVTLLATVAHQHQWDNNRLVREWKQRQTGILQTGYNRNLARTIELSLASPMFRDLGPDARGLLEVVAFFPQGVDENNLDWLFPAIPNRTTISDMFCVLSLTYRNNGFITMLAPLRDYLCPQDPISSPLLCATKNRYFTRMSIDFNRNKPAFRESRWIATEDVNVEHLLDVLASLGANSDEVWLACSNFMTHLYWHKPRRTVLSQKIEDLPSYHRYKHTCLFVLSQLSTSVGDQVERKRLLDQTLELVRDQGDDDWVARTLRELSDVNRKLGFYKEGIQQAREALEIYQRLSNTVEAAKCWNFLAFLLHEDNQLDAAKEAASQAIDLIPEKGQEFVVCQSHRLLGNIYRSKCEGENSIHHFETALAIASPFNWHDLLFWVHYDLVSLFLVRREFSSAHTHIEQAKSYATGDTYNQARAVNLQAVVWFRQCRLKEAKSGALRASEIYEKFGAAKDLEACKALLREIERAMESQPRAPDNSDSNAHVKLSST